MAEDGPVRTGDRSTEPLPRSESVAVVIQRANLVLQGTEDVIRIQHLPEEFSRVRNENTPEETPRDTEPS